MAKTHKKYEIDTFEKLINVATSENFELLSVDLLQWLNFTISTIESIRKNNPKETEGKLNWEITKSTFIWVDDGKNDFKGATIKNENTGEIKIIKPRK